MTSKRKKGPTALEQAEALQEQLQALENAINQIHTIQVVYWPSGDIFRASGTGPGTVEALTGTKIALQNAIAQLDTQILEVATAQAVASQQPPPETVCEVPQEAPQEQEE